jgi:DNA-directed RNA polymerase specialized sigma subunit
MQISRRTSDSDGLHPGVLETLDERTELRRRVHLMEERDRHVLFLWYVRQLPLKQIARELGVSGRQCQRLRAKAVKTVVELGQQDSEEAVA